MISAKHLVYMLAVSLALIVALVGWTLWQNHQHQVDLADAVVFRQQEVNQFLRTEVCERLELRDEIQISYLKAAAAKHAESDPLYSSVLADAAQAIEFTQRDCPAELPGVRPK